MKATLAVITTIGLFVLFWAFSAVALWLVLNLTPPNILGEKINYLINKLLVWVLAPGAGAYFGVKYSCRWFNEVKVESIASGFLGALITLTIIVIGFNVTFFIANDSRINEWLELIGLAAQIAAAIIGTNIAKSEQLIPTEHIKDSL